MISDILVPKCLTLRRSKNESKISNNCQGVSLCPNWSAALKEQQRYKDLLSSSKLQSVCPNGSQWVCSCLSFNMKRHSILTNACCISHDLIKCCAYVRLLQETCNNTLRWNVRVHQHPTVQSSIYYASSSPTRFNFLKSQLVFHHSEWEIYIHDISCPLGTFATSIVWLEQVTFFHWVFQWIQDTIWT